MKILILGANGYIGRHLSESLTNSGHKVIDVSRTTLDFDSEDILINLEILLLKELPRVVINAIGTIDCKVQSDPVKLFNAILLPTYGLFEFYAKSKELENINIFILGSTSAGEPRMSYPLYAALKAAEVALSKTAHETFLSSGIVWKLLIVPRLNGGLGVQENEDAFAVTTLDEGLEELADTICQEITELS